MVLSLHKGFVVSDKNKIFQDWKNIGDDIRVVVYGKQLKSLYNYDKNAFVKGIATLNPFGGVATENTRKQR